MAVPGGCCPLSHNSYKYSLFHPAAWLVDKFHDMLFFDLGVVVIANKVVIMLLMSIVFFLSYHLNVQIRITVLIIIIKFYKVAYHPIL